VFQVINSRIPACSVSTELIELVVYFDATYVSGPVRSIHGPDGDVRVRLARSSPTFPPNVWNVYEETIADGERTNNLHETWNKAFSVLVGYR